MSANGISNDSTIDEMMISFPAPDGPLTMETMRLGPMAMTRVMRFRTQLFISMSRNPCMITCPANVQLIVVLCPEASSATAYTLMLLTEHGVFLERTRQSARTSCTV